MFLGFIKNMLASSLMILVYRYGQEIIHYI